jgi:cell division protein ZipA
MLASMSDETLLRLIIAGASLVLILFIILSWHYKSKNTQKLNASRIEPKTPQSIDADIESVEENIQKEFKEQSDLGFGKESVETNHNQIGVRKSDAYEKLVMLYLAAKSGHHITGAELVLAAEKVGLVYGHHNIYHRLSESTKSNEPVFSMANVIQPGYFDLRQIDSLQTPGVSFFLTLPGPVTAIQAWDTMLPIAERMAQLLDAVLLDSDRNALGRQRILHIKEELRSFDREKERQTIKPGR